jgi:hypothetical protein
MKPSFLDAAGDPVGIAPQVRIRVGNLAAVIVVPENVLAVGKLLHEIRGAVCLIGCPPGE